MATELGETRPDLFGISVLPMVMIFVPVQGERMHQLDAIEYIAIAIITTANDAQLEFPL